MGSAALASHHATVVPPHPPRGCENAPRHPSALGMPFPLPAEKHSGGRDPAESEDKEDDIDEDDEIPPLETVDLADPFFDGSPDLEDDEDDELPPPVCLESDRDQDMSLWERLRAEYSARLSSFIKSYRIGGHYDREGLFSRQYLVTEESPAAARVHDPKPSSGLDLVAPVRGPPSALAVPFPLPSEKHFEAHRRDAAEAEDKEDDIDEDDEIHSAETVDPVDPFFDLPDKSCDLEDGDDELAPRGVKRETRPRHGGAGDGAGRHHRGRGRGGPPYRDPPPHPLPPRPRPRSRIRGIRARYCMLFGVPAPPGLDLVASALAVPFPLPSELDSEGTADGEPPMDWIIDCLDRGDKAGLEAATADFPGLTWADFPPEERTEPPTFCLEMAGLRARPLLNPLIRKETVNYISSWRPRLVREDPSEIIRDIRPDRWHSFSKAAPLIAVSSLTGFFFLRLDTMEVLQTGDEFGYGDHNYALTRCQVGDRPALAVAQYDSICFVDLQTRKVIHRIDKDDVEVSAVLCDLPSEFGDDLIAATGGTTWAIHLWEKSEGHPIARFTGHHDSIEALSCAPRRKWLASGSRDGTTRLWDCETEQTLPDGVFELREGSSVRDVLFGSKQQSIFSGGKRGPTMFSLDSFECVRRFPGPYDCHSLLLHPTNEFLFFSGHSLGEVILWDIRKEDEWIGIRALHLDDHVDYIAHVGVGRFASCSGFGGAVRVWREDFAQVPDVFGNRRGMTTSEEPTGMCCVVPFKDESVATAAAVAQEALEERIQFLILLSGEDENEVSFAVRSMFRGVRCVGVASFLLFQPRTPI